MDIKDFCKALRALINEIEDKARMLKVECGGLQRRSQGGVKEKAHHAMHDGLL